MKIRLSGNLLRFSSFQSQIEVDAKTVLSALHALVAQHPALASVLLDGRGRPRAIHRLFLNGDMLRGDDVEGPVNDGDELAVLTAIAGG
jgi:sulfur-carrier protein